MKTGTTIISLICFLTFGAFAGMAQTLTCTFQFTASGVIGTPATATTPFVGQTFTNASVTITTVGNTANRQSQPYGGYYISNDSSFMSISGIGNFQITGPIPTFITSTPNVDPVKGVIGNYIALAYNYSGPNIGPISEWMRFTVSTTTSWSMVTSFGPIQQSLGLQLEPTTNGGTVVFNNGVFGGTGVVTFQATISGTATPPPPTLSRVGVLSHIAAGGWWSTVITLINTSTTSELITVNFHNDDGSAMTLPVTTTLQGTSQTTTTSSVNATINPNATLLISMGDPAAPTAVGWADVLGSGPIGGYAIFRETPSTQSSEGTVPLQSQFPTTFTLPYDNSSGFVMGVALANLSTSFANITATMWDANGNQLGAQTITIPGNGHTSFVLPTELPLTAGKLGIVKFQATGGIAGLGLRFSPFGTFTSVPTM